MLRRTMTRYAALLLPLALRDGVSECAMLVSFIVDCPPNVLASLGAERSGFSFDLHAIRTNLMIRTHAGTGTAIHTTQESHMTGTCICVNARCVHEGKCKRMGVPCSLVGDQSCALVARRANTAATPRRQGTEAHAWQDKGGACFASQNQHSKVCAWKHAQR